MTLLCTICSLCRISVCVFTSPFDNAVMPAATKHDNCRSLERLFQRGSRRPAEDGAGKSPPCSLSSSFRSVKTMRIGNWIQDKAIASQLESRGSSHMRLPCSPSLGHAECFHCWRPLRKQQRYVEQRHNNAPTRIESWTEWIRPDRFDTLSPLLLKMHISVANGLPS